MYYKLKPPYLLRGWEKMSWALVRRPNNEVKVLKQEEFQVLLLCDGETDVNAEYVTSEMRTCFQRYEEEGIIESHANKTMLDKEQYYQYYNNRYVRFAFWSITGHCNYRCRHCYMDAPKGALGELSHKQAISLIDQMAECGILQVDLTGGEPFVRKDFWKLVDKILSYKMSIGQIYTNGWLLTDAILDRFEERGLRPEFSISFDGVGWHDWRRGIKGAEEATLRALILCVKRGFPVNVEMCVHKGNVSTLRETVKLLADIGVPSVKISNVSQTALWEENSEGNAMNIRMYMDEMLRYIPYYFEDGMPMDVMLSGVVTFCKNSKDYKIFSLKFSGTDKCLNQHLCGVTRYACYIAPEGRLLPCMPMTACKDQSIFPLVQDIGLKKGLSDSFYLDIVDSRVKDLMAANSECAVCEYKFQCGGGCRANALRDTRDLMGCDRDQCILWKEGYIDRIREVTEAAIAKYCTDHTEDRADT